jgi:hypothetical protein
MIRTRSEAGYSMVEVLFAFLLLSVVTSGFYVVVFGQQRSGSAARSIANISEETRLGFTRMVRDTREGDLLTAATPTSYTVKVNFDGDAFYENPNQNLDDETLTYAYDASTKTITLNGSVLMQGVRPIPGRDVFSYSSNNLDYDWGGDGTTTWQDLDAASSRGVTGVGSNPSNGLLDAEIGSLTTVHYALTVYDGERFEEFSSVAQMRNRV